MKVAFVGGGGFRTPTLCDCITSAAAQIGIDELVLHDVDPERLELILDVVEGMNRERGGSTVSIRATTSLEDAVEGAGAVLAAIRVGGAEARVIDEEVPLSLGVLGQETVGPAGIAFALRTIPVIRSIAAVVRDRAPSAWFVNFTNPAGVVTQAVRSVLGDRAIGICDSPAALCSRVAAALNEEEASIDFDYAGLNHLGWLLAARVANGRDRLPGLLDDEGRLSTIDEARLLGLGKIRSLGAIPNEYLVYVERASEVTTSLRREGGRGGIVAEQQRIFYDRRPGDPTGALGAWRAVRDARHGTYLAEAGPREGARPPGPRADGGRAEEGYAAIATDFLHAVSANGERRLILNTANGDRLQGVGPEEVVEVSCAVDATGVRPLPGLPLPPEAGTTLARIKDVERLTLLAAATGSAAHAVDAIAAHPVVPSRDVAERIWARYEDRHRMASG
jgi:6-phospho-beta-glucosidase